MTILKNKEWEDAIKTGLPITYVERNKIIRLFKGKKTIIKKLKKKRIILPKKFELI